MTRSAQESLAFALQQQRAELDIVEDAVADEDWALAVCALLDVAKAIGPLLRLVVLVVEPSSLFQPLAYNEKQAAAIERLAIQLMARLPADHPLFAEVPR